MASATSVSRRAMPRSLLGIEESSCEGIGARTDGTAVRQKQNIRGAGYAIVWADDRATGLDGLSPRAAELMDQIRLSRRTEGHKRKPTHTCDQPENGDNDYHLGQGKSQRRQPRTAHRAPSLHGRIEYTAWRSAAATNATNP